MKVNGDYRFAYFTGGGDITTTAAAATAATTTTTTTTATTTTASSDDRATSSVDSLRRDVAETRDSVRRLDSHVSDLARDVSVLSSDVRTLLRALQSVLQPAPPDADERAAASRPPRSSTGKPHSHAKTAARKCSRCEPPAASRPSSADYEQSSRPPSTSEQLLLLKPLSVSSPNSPDAQQSAKPPTIWEQQLSFSSRPPTSSAPAQRKRGSLVDAGSPELVDMRLRGQRLPDDHPVRTPRDSASQAPAAGRRLSRAGSGSSRDSVIVADDVDGETTTPAVSEQTYVFSDNGPPTATISRRAAAEWQPGVPVSASETTATVARSRSRAVAAAQLDNADTQNAPPSTGMSTSTSHASVLLTTDL